MTSSLDATGVRPISSADVGWEEFAGGPRFALRYKPLTIASMGPDYHVGVSIEELDPGKQSCPAHYHFHEEEHVYLLEGTLTVRIGPDRYEMKAGDYVCFPAGQKAGHCLINHSAAPARYVIVGESNPKEVAVYTDSNKVLIRALGRRAIFDLSARRGYWDGENTGLSPTQSPPPDEVSTASEPPVKPHAPISSDEVPWDDEPGPGRGTRFGGRSKHLTHAALGSADYRVGMVIESPAPGRRLCPNHYHVLEEEHALILEGQVRLLLGNEQYDLKPGDYVCFPAARPVAHSFLNSGTGACSYLMIGERNTHDVCVYPDSGKIGIAGLRSRTLILDMATVKSYWDGEETA